MDNHDSTVTAQNAGHAGEPVNGMVSLTTLPSAGMVEPVTPNPAGRLDSQVAAHGGHISATDATGTAGTADVYGV
jgi:hypothetical protein